MHPYMRVQDGKILVCLEIMTLIVNIDLCKN